MFQILEYFVMAFLAMIKVLKDAAMAYRAYLPKQLLTKTAAAGQLLDPAVWDMALPLLLQHPSIATQPSIVCMLLCVSKQSQTAINKHCAGQLPVCLVLPGQCGSCSDHEQSCSDDEQSCSEHEQDMLHAAGAFAKWLRHNAGLLSSLQLNSDIMLPNSIDDMLAMSLQHAAAAGPGSIIQLQHYSTNMALTPRVLQQLPVSTLTALHVQYFNNHVDGDFGSRPDQVTGLLPGLCRLTGLQELRLCSQEHAIKRLRAEPRFLALGGPDPVIPSLTNLTKLTSLQLRSVADLGALRLLPTSLQHLQLGLGWWVTFARLKDLKGPGVRCLDLGHLAVLTRLQLEDVGEEGQVQEYVLPSSLVELLVDTRFYTLMPPTNLQRLKVLALSTCTLQAGSLQQLSGLRSLKEVHLSHHPRYLFIWGDRSFDANQAAAGWAMLPLVSLELHGRGSRSFDAAALSASTLEQLGRLTQLQKLCIRDYELCASAHVLAGRLENLTGLTGLFLSNVRLASQREAALHAIQLRYPRMPQQFLQDELNRQQSEDQWAAHQLPFSQRQQLAATQQQAGYDAAGMLALAKAVAGLPRLVAANLCWQFDAAARAELAAANCNVSTLHVLAHF